jgi:hypothetical protein
VRAGAFIRALALSFVLCGCAVEPDAVGPANVREQALASGATRLRWAQANEIAAGGSVTCALTGDQRALHCWGNHIVQFDAGGNARETPCARAVDQDSCSKRPLWMDLAGVAQIALTQRGDGCALQDDGEAICWRFFPRVCPDCEGVRPWIPHISRPEAQSHLRGAVRLIPCYGGFYGVMASGPLDWTDCDEPQFQDAEGLIANGYGCERRRDGSIWCWGSHEHGQLGVGDSASAELSVCERYSPGGRVTYPCAKEPVKVGRIHDAVHMDGELVRTCAVLKDGSVHCWGLHYDAPDQHEAHPSPRPVEGLEGIRRVVVRSKWLCALDSRGDVHCLGDNQYGQLGDRKQQWRNLPRRVPLPGPVVAIVAGGSHACVLLDDRSLWCWGGNRVGQLGDGTDEDRLSPVRTLPPGSVSKPAYPSDEPRG